jgi:Flp pilus assembly protein TadG
MSDYRRFLNRVATRSVRASAPGQSIIMFAVMLPVLIGFVGLGVDGTLFFVTQGRLQAAVDAAALAGAQDLPGTAAFTVACDYAARNDVPGTQPDGSPSMTVPPDSAGTDCPNGKAAVTLTSNTITVEAAHVRRPFFMQVIPGFSDEDIPMAYARATASAGAVGVSCISPFYLQRADFMSGSPLRPDYWKQISFKKGDMIRVGDPGTQRGRDAIKDAVRGTGCPKRNKVIDFPETGDPAVDLLDAEEDVFSGQTAAEAATEAWADRFARIPGSACPNADPTTYKVGTRLDPALTMDNCPRLFIMPVLQDTIPNNKQNADVLGFVAFYVQGYCPGPQRCDDPTKPGADNDLFKGNFWGYYVPYSVSAAYASTSISGQFGLTSIYLSS